MAVRQKGIPHGPRMPTFSEIAFTLCVQHFSLPNLLPLFLFLSSIRVMIFSSRLYISLFFISGPPSWGFMTCMKVILDFSSFRLILLSLAAPTPFHLPSTSNSFQQFCRRDIALFAKPTSLFCNPAIWSAFTFPPSIPRVSCKFG